jgi:glucan 1,3-beta-glucosidase
MDSNYESYQTVRRVSGLGANKGPYVSYHDSFLPLSTWAGSLAGADRVVLDSHPYFAFDSPASPDPIDTGTGPTAGGLWPGRACTRWGAAFNTRWIHFFPH